MATKRKPSCHHNLAEKSDSESVDLRPNKDQQTSPPITISKILLISLVLGGVGMTAILCRFEGVIDFKLGRDGVQVVIDGRKAALLPPITDNSADTK